MAYSAKHHQCAQKQARPALHFCPHEAEALGLPEAIVLARLRFWLGRSKHVFGGRAWVYNTYADWQRQFPFWSTFTVKAVFRRLERLGVLESTQRFNTNRWNRTKWYTLNAEALPELVGSDVAPGVGPTLVPSLAEPAAADQAVAMGADAAIEGEPAVAIDGSAAAAIDGGDFVPCLEAERSPERSTKRTCPGEPAGGARPPALETTNSVVSADHHGEKPVNELDAAYAEIPEAERETWYERAERALAETGMPEWMRIVPTVKEAAWRLWAGTSLPGLAPG